MPTNAPDKAFMVRDFTPGYLDSPESDTLPWGATPDAKNAFLYNVDVAQRRAVMGRRPGSRLVHTTAAVAEKVWDGLFEWAHAGSRTLLGVIDGTLHSVDVVGASVTSIGSGWTAGNPARVTPFRSDAFVYDGAYQRRWDGTTLYEVGSAAPGTITNMAAGAGTVTGTYEALYTWYNANRDRHSSPSDITATLVLAGQGRTHTKPASAAPSWATHWGTWVRRTDTSELNFFFVANTAIATAGYTETVTDVVRQRGDVAPLPSSHDAPPGAWLVLNEFKGYGIGILDGSDSYYTSAVGDLESWSPKNKFPVSRATGEYLCWAKEFGTEMLLGTSHRMWRLVNDEPPFVAQPVHPRFGNVSQDACLEVDGWFYGWDRIAGPYRTNLVEWQQLGLHRIDDTLETINRTALAGIKCVYAEKQGLIGWAVPTSGSARRRTILWYHIELGCWLPPQTGLEYGSLTAFTDASGTLGVYCGDYWGRVLELFSGAKEGVPTTSPTDNLRKAAVVSATSSTVTVNNSVLSLYTTGSGLAGLPVAAVSGAGVWQWRTIKSNTANVITLDTTNGAPWNTVPDDSYTVVVGGIEWFWWTPWIDFALPHLTKTLQHLYVQARATSSDHLLEIKMRFNNDEGVVENIEFAFNPALTAGIWDSGRWDEALWAETQRQLRKRKIQRSPISCQIRFSNAYPDQELTIPLYGLSADPLPGMQVASA